MSKKDEPKLPGEERLQIYLILNSMAAAMECQQKMIELLQKQVDELKKQPKFGISYPKGKSDEE